MYKIVDFYIDVQNDTEQKCHEYLKLFATAESEIEETSKTIVQFAHVNSDEAFAFENNKVYGQVESKESVCYGIRHKQLLGRWSHLITREKPLTEGFLVANEAWQMQRIVDDCRMSGENDDLRWKRRLSGKRNTLYEDNEWIELFLAGFYSYAALHETMLIHASVVKYQDKAILFTAPSGTGKTTQAELWNKYMGAKILNGDRVFIRGRGQENKLYAWGSPWAGSSPYIVNDCAELAAIVVLRQAKENRINKLGLPEAMQGLLNNSFIPMWDSGCLDGMLKVLDKVLKHTPVYMLECCPNKEAVNMVMKEVFERGRTT